MNAPISVVVADDHPLVREGITAYLRGEADMTVVGEAADAETAVELCRGTRPDVVILDMVMPGGGAEAVKRIRQASSSSRIIVLTSSGDGALALGAIKAGALSYLLKEATPEELALAIRRAACGEAVVSERIGAAVAHVLRSQSSLLELLTPREQEVLRLIAEGLDNRAVAERLAIAEKTVKVHVSNLLGKLGLAHRTQAAVLAWRSGWVERPPEGRP
jgi:NarL family two-component system response regulator LiaR